MTDHELNEYEGVSDAQDEIDKLEDIAQKFPITGKHREGLRQALKWLGLEYRYDIRQKQPFFKVNGEWRATNDRIEATIIADIRLKCALTGKQYKKTEANFGRESWKMGIDALMYEAEVDPVKEWMEDLPEWDKTFRIDSILSDLFGTPQGEEIGSRASELRQWASRYPLIGAIQRTMEPGCLLKQFPILIGYQDAGKSALVKELCPISDWYASGLRLHDKQQNQIELMQGRLIIEIDELVGIYKAEIEALKSFISRTDDGAVRLVWRKNPESTPRRCIFVGTTNDDSCLPNDPTGNVRFVPIKLPAKRCLKGKVEDWVEKNRIQLWAEALHRYRQGERANLPDDLRPQAAIVAKAATQSDPLMDERMASLPNEPMRSDKVLSICFDLNPREVASKITQQRSRELFRNLRGRGWEYNQKKVQGKKMWMWFPPEGHQQIIPSMKEEEDE